ncbi:MAG: phage holin family protein, partial [Eubacteriales bacterium]|nr:phage holin family protein [Eubacteriales bacterium]
FAATVAAVPLCGQYLPGVQMTDWTQAAVIGAILGALYMLLRPVARLLLKVLNWLTLGLLYVGIDAWLVWTAVSMMPDAMTLENFWWAVAVAAIVNAARTLIGVLTGTLRH